MTSPSADGVPSPPTPSEHLGWLADATDRFTAVLSGADLAAPVPSCPGWDLAALGGHLGGVHSWAAGAVREGHPDTEVTPPAGRSALPGWYREQADGLLAVLRDVGPDAEAWSFGPKPRTAGFWFRRQLHETSMHLWDALSATGDGLGDGSGSGSGYGSGYGSGNGGGDATDAARRAADGVDEVVRMFFPRQVRLGRTAQLTRSLALASTDVPGRWTLSGDGTGDGGAGPAAEATVTGPAQALVLLLWGRLDLDTTLAAGTLHLDGDPEAARTVLAAALTP
jgi:hypothetical protein